MTIFTRHSPEWLAQTTLNPIGWDRIPTKEDHAREKAWARYWRKVDGLPPHPDNEEDEP